MIRSHPGDRRRLAGFVVAACLAFLTSTASGQDDEPEGRGFGVPRPVDRNSRELLGFPPPRKPNEILASFDSVTEQIKAIAAGPHAVWRKRKHDYRAMQRRRVNLVSELEESGYQGKRLKVLLGMKLVDIDQAAPPADAWMRLRLEMASRYKGTPVGGEAKARSALKGIEFMRLAHLRVHPNDYQRLAAIELGWKHHELAGMLILEALYAAKGSQLERRWHDWILKHLPPSSRGYRLVMQKRGFGKPIRLVGEGLGGESIDTAAWKGDVILVDFWGTW